MEVCGRRTVVCDVVLPVGKLSTKCIPKVVEQEAHSKLFRHVRDDPISEECPHFRLGTVAEGENLQRRPELVQRRTGKVLSEEHGPCSVASRWPSAARSGRTVRSWHG